MDQEVVMRVYPEGGKGQHLQLQHYNYIHIDESLTMTQRFNVWKSEKGSLHVYLVL